MTPRQSFTCLSCGALLCSVNGGAIAPAHDGERTQFRMGGALVQGRVFPAILQIDITCACGGETRLYWHDGAAAPTRIPPDLCDGIPLTELTERARGLGVSPP